MLVNVALDLCACSNTVSFRSRCVPISEVLVTGDGFELVEYGSNWGAGFFAFPATEAAALATLRCGVTRWCTSSEERRGWRELRLSKRTGPALPTEPKTKDREFRIRTVSEKMGGTSTTAPVHGKSTTEWVGGFSVSVSCRLQETPTTPMSTTRRVQLVPGRMVPVVESEGTETAMLGAVTSSGSSMGSPIRPVSVRAGLTEYDYDPDTVYV
ncbi:hypothetical protein FIBSPDRAFT_902418 [Athelia psychrophila]|uniref:Uncharacterized protein n=1 Tax=Athelia psychrophila TaxID=1759441 RepID=A0A167X8L4_9AGAM|nr:hypothetical protein FIBSPDRAFT_902418 [Fibularhizoctonia sp. CBS 109695]